MLLKNLVLKISVLAFPLIVGCSRLDIATNYADVFLTHRASQYFNLNSEQKKNLKREISSEITSLKKKDIPSLCQSIEGQTSLATSYGLLKDFKTLTQEKIEPKVQTLMSDLSESQWSHFKKKFKADLESKSKEIEKYSKKQQKNLTKQLDNALGSLSSEQKKLIQRFHQDSPYPRKLQIENWHQFLHLSPEENKKWVKDFLIAPDKIMTPQYKNALERFNFELQQLLQQIDKNMSQDQTTHLKKYLNSKCTELS